MNANVLLEIAVMRLKAGGVFDILKEKLEFKEVVMK